jgi:hypothetical protein
MLFIIEKELEINIENNAYEIITNEIESKRSNKPPCPGNILLKSFIPLCLLQILKKRSPIIETIQSIAIITIAVIHHIVNEN